MCEIETALQTAQRTSFGYVREINRLETNLFPDGDPAAGELVEIVGESNSGKSCMLLELIVKLILPANCGGQGQAAILLDCENTFNVRQVLSLLEKHIHNYADQTVANELRNPHTLRSIQEESLGRLELIKCYSWQELEFTLLQLPNVLLEKRHLSCLLLDSIASFYWHKCSEKNLIRMDTFQSVVCAKLRKLCQEWKLFAVFTKPAYFGATTRDGYGSIYEGSELSSQQSIATSSVMLLTGSDSFRGSTTSKTVPPDYRIELVELPNHTSRPGSPDIQRFNALITSKDKQYVRFYMIDKLGISWIEA